VVAGGDFEGGGEGVVWEEESDSVGEAA
jgi:hypothetical protein